MSLDISQERQCTHIATVCSIILGGCQLVELLGWSRNLWNVNCSGHSSVFWGVGGISEVFLG